MLAEFDVVVGRSLAHVLEVLEDRPDARVVAGATDLIPFVRAGRWRPSLVVDITRLEELRGIRLAEGGLELGALVTHAELLSSPPVREHAPLLAEAAGCVAGPQVRARGTLGGNLCTASPAADSVPALLVLDAQVRLIGTAGERRLPLAQFLVGPGKTALLPGELLQGVYLPSLPPGSGASFGKVGKRRALVISVVNGAALLARQDGRITQARLALGAVAPTVVRCSTAEALLIGKQPAGAEHLAQSRQDAKGDERDLASWRLGVRCLFDEAAECVIESILPIDDVRGSAAYRRAAAVGLTRRLLAEAWDRGAR
jgi:CO/xanthine dehydrogenase FAD-binding subunit